MITLRKIAYVVGITIAVSAFVIFLYSAVPQMIQHNGWDNLDVTPMNNEEMLEKFKAHPAYADFYERFPDAKEELSYHKKNNRGELQVGMRNFDTGVELVLQFNYNGYDDDINAHIDCRGENISEPGINGPSLRANGLFVTDFIEQTDCLELKGSITNTEFNPPKIISGPNDSTIIITEPNVSGAVTIER